MRELILVSGAVLAAKAAATPSSTSDEEDTPMSAERDIVERLRKDSRERWPERLRDGHAYHSLAQLEDEAAAEITRLREALAQSPEDAEWLNWLAVDMKRVPQPTLLDADIARFRAIANRLSGVRE